ncbi:MAG: hypothetical protein FWD47_05025 [Treponema sp.]|nr:hypothetical protein [Treponema sp.]
MKTGIFITIFLFAASICVFPVPIEDLIPSDTAALLRASERGQIIETQLRNPTPKLLPQNTELRQYVNLTRNSLNPNIMIEALYLYTKPSIYHSSVQNWDERQKIGIFNQLTAISTLTGIQYFSASRNTMRIFYESSTVIDNAQAKNPLPDPVYTQLPQTLTLNARQIDSTFGDNIYSYHYINTADSIFFSQTNTTAMSYGIIPAIGRGNLRSIIAVIDCGDSILVYAVSMARASTIPGMGDRISNSFNNRAIAVLNWFTNRINSEIFIR